MNATTPSANALDAPDAGLRLVLPGRSCSFGDGAAWVGRGWKLFTAAWLMWVISTVVLLVVSLASNLLPIVGALIMGVINPVILGGFIAACRSLETGGDFEIEHLLAGFSRRFGKLALLGAILLAGEIVIAIVFAMFVGFSVLMAIMAGDQQAIASAIYASVGTLLVGTLVCTLLLLPLLAAVWFAPALIYMHDMNVGAAMAASFSASFRNLLSTLLYALIMLPLALIAVIPIGLGLLVWIPLMLASTYAAYRDIFTEDVAAGEVAPGEVVLVPPATPIGPAA